MERPDTPLIPTRHDIQALSAQHASTALLAFVAVLLAPLALFLACSSQGTSRSGDADPTSAPAGRAQAPSWSDADLEFFLHGSMSTEVVPETVLAAFTRAFPDLFPAADLSNFGLLPDPAAGIPVGFSKAKVEHLGGLTSIGMNCAACHVGEVVASAGSRPVRVLGMTAPFDAEGFLGAVIIATFRCAYPESMRAFLSARLDLEDPRADSSTQPLFARAWSQQRTAIEKMMAADTTGARGAPPGSLVPIDPTVLRLDARLLADGASLAACAGETLKLFHNIRAALHVPDQPPEKAPPASGPGRNDAFGLLSAELFGVPVPYAPVKYGLVWNVEGRSAVHWDGNTQSALARNLLASLGLGAPLVGRRAMLDLALIKRHTDLTQRIAAPRYPFAIDQALAARGAPLFAARCARCHEGPDGDQRLYDPIEIGTDPQRALLFTAEQAARFNDFLAGVESPGYQPPATPGIRSTRKYWAASLAGVWARAPYLHNGSVRTIGELLLAPAERPASFRRGSKAYDASALGFTDEGPYVLDSRTPGNSNAGHDYGSDLPPDDRRALIEYLKTL